MSHAYPFRTLDGEAEFLAAYEAAMQRWPVSYETVEPHSRFGTTHVVVCGPKEAPPLVLLHGYMATLTMWAPNVADFSRAHRVYAIDVMGQPGKSVPAEPIRSAADYVEWLTATLDALHLERISLAGMSYGGWLALSFALASPQRVQKLVLLSPAASLLPLVRQFLLRGMLMVLWPARLTVNWFMGWLGLTTTCGEDFAPAVELTYLGLKHFRMAKETQRVVPSTFTDDELRAMHVPTLLLIGKQEVIYDPAAALARARRFMPDLQGELVSNSRHEMCFSQRRIVDARVLDFLSDRTRDGSARAA